MGSGTLAPEHLAAMGPLLLSWALILSTIPCLISSPQFGSNSPCSPSPCGPGALCENKGLGQVLCSCPPGQTGDPLAEGCSPDTRRRPLNGAGGRGGGGGFSFGLVVRARLALEDQCPTLVLEGVPTLVGRPQVLEASLATDSLTANLTDSARELQAAVLTLAQTTLKQAGPRVAGARLARRLDTRRSAPAPGITLEIRLCPVALSPPRISAGQIRAVPTLIVNLGLTTGPAKIVQCVFVTRGTEGTV